MRILYQYLFLDGQYQTRYTGIYIPTTRLACIAKFSWLVTK